LGTLNLKTFNIQLNKQTGIGTWSQEEIVTLLRTGQQQEAPQEAAA
jgi:hypothetical protein